MNKNKYKKTILISLLVLFIVTLYFGFSALAEEPAPEPEPAPVSSPAEPIVIGEGLEAEKVREGLKKSAETLPQEYQQRALDTLAGYSNDQLIRYGRQVMSGTLERDTAYSLLGLDWTEQVAADMFISDAQYQQMLSDMEAWITGEVPAVESLDEAPPGVAGATPGLGALIQEIQAAEKKLPECMKVKREKGGLFQFVSDECFKCGDCSLCDMMSVFVAIANIILASLGAVAVITFMWGTFGLVMSKGNPEVIQGSKKVIRGTVVGIVIVLIAWQLSAVFIAVLLKSTTGNMPGLFTSWFHVGEFCQKEWQ